MSYLLDFIRTFDEEEMAVFQNLDLSSKEQIVRDIYCKEAKNKNFHEPTLRIKLKMKQSYFDKITSVLLDKIIAHLFGDDYNKAFFVILQKGLSDLMLHEVKILERKILKEDVAANIIKFYKAAFDNLRRMFHPAYNSQLTHLFGKKYLESLGKKKTLRDETYIAMMTMYGDIIAAHRSGNEERGKPGVQKDLKKWEKKVKAAKDPVVEFYYAYALITFYRYMGNSVEDFLNAAELAHAAYEKGTMHIDKGFKGSVLCELAFGYTESNRFEEALKHYGEAIEQFPETIAKSIFHVGNYVLLSIINGYYLQAQNTFETLALPKILPGSNRSMLSDIYTMGCLLNLYQKKYDEAFRYLNLLGDYQKTEVTEISRAIVRILKPLYFLHIKDYRTAESQVKSGAKFFSRVGTGVEIFNYYVSFTQAIAKTIKFKQGFMRNSEKLKEEISGLPKGIYMVYNLLLYRLMGMELN